MTETALKCVKIDSQPFPLIVPVECVAEIVTTPEIENDPSQRAKWMAGYVVWNGQEVPLLCFADLVLPNYERPDSAPKVTILNPIPKAPRKTYGALLSFGAVDEVSIESTIADMALPTEIDRRYCEAAFELQGQTLIVPRLAALGVAFSYY